MKSVRNRFLMIGLAITIAISLVGCSGYGKKIVVEGTEIYFDGQTVTREDAELLGTYLVAVGFSDGVEKSVQLVREGGGWQFRMVTRDEYVNDTDYHRLVAFLASDMSEEIFNGEPVVFHLCNDTFETLKVIEAEPMLSFITVNGVDIFYDDVNVTTVEAELLGQFLVDSGFSDGTPKSVHLALTGGVWQFRMVAMLEIVNDPEFIERASIFAAELSHYVFNNEPVEVHLCDEYFETLKVISIE